MIPNTSSRILLVLLLAAACGGLVTVLGRAGWLEGLELRTLDARFRLMARPERASPDVILAAVDDKSLEAFKRNNVVWKWPRDLYGALVRYLHRGGARLIVFDILFSDPDADRAGSDAEETDGAFAESMREAGNVVLAAHLGDREDLLERDNPLVRPNPFRIEPSARQDRFPRFPSAVLPIPLFQRTAAALGPANYEGDPPDGVCRRLPLLALFREDVFPHLGMAAFLLARGEHTVAALPSGRLRVGDVDVPVDRSGRFLISWYGPGGPEGCFATYSVAALIASAVAEETGRTPLLPSSRFRDKIVIVGASAAGLFDYRVTPFTAVQPYPAMEIYATVLSNLLQQDFLVRVRPWVPAAAVFLFSLGVCAAFFRLRQLRVVVPLVFLAGAGWLGLCLALFRGCDRWLDLVAPELSLGISFMAAAAASYGMEGRERRRLRSVFSRYVSPAVVAEVLDRRETLELGGREVTATLFFSDLKDFTALSEVRSARDVVEMLNAYFTVATEQILNRQGLLDKYIGDAIMAMFGGLLPGAGHAAQACHAALDIQRALGASEAAARAGRPPLVTRIGLHTGPVVAGNIGSPLRMEYTAIGDTVNLASRLEGANKLFATRILISEATERAAGGGFVTRELDRLRLKGKRTAVVCFELVGREGEVSPDTIRRIGLFLDGLRWYRDRAFEKALASFEALLSSEPGDGPAAVYRDRCRAFLASPPAPDWDGTHTLETK